jgi:cell division protein FtsB|tara:strand:+ start:483 stop:746 length:264 start_codon:yes stop_codon:yes gene_type:complete
MNVKEMTLEDLGITCEFVDAIVAAKMIEQYYDIKRDINLKNKSFEKLEQYEKEDLEDNIRLLDATEIMLKYFTPQDQWEKIMCGKNE